MRGALGVGAMRGRGADTQRDSQRSTAVRKRDARAVGGMLIASVDDSKSAMRRTEPRSRTRATRDAARTKAPIDHKPGLVLSLASLGATPPNDDTPALQRATTEPRELSSTCWRQRRQRDAARRAPGAAARMPVAVETGIAGARLHPAVEATCAACAPT